MVPFPCFSTHRDGSLRLCSDGRYRNWMNEWNFSVFHRIQSVLSQVYTWFFQCTCDWKGLNSDKYMLLIGCGWSHHQHPSILSKHDSYCVQLFNIERFISVNWRNSWMCLNGQVSNCPPKSGDIIISGIYLETSIFILITIIYLYQDRLNYADLGSKI